MKRDDAHDPRAIANRILDIRLASGEPLTIMQLIKLVYIADGWSIALLGKPLSKETPQAWQYGPVYPTVYRAFSGLGSRPVEGRACVRGTTIPLHEELSPDEEKIIDMVVRGYGKLSAYQLSRLTHQPGTPWSKAYDEGLYADINIDEIKTHFSSLRADRLATAH